MKSGVRKNPPAGPERPWRWSANAINATIERVDTGRAGAARGRRATRRRSEHPLAQAIVTGARDRGSDVDDPDAFYSVTGRGVQATVAGRAVLVEGFFTPSSTDAHNREIIISDYDPDPEMRES